MHSVAALQFPAQRNLDSTHTAKTSQLLAWCVTAFTVTAFTRLCRHTVQG